ncbi:MAG: hypothetical protein IJU42_06600 [Erysipelotrichaceae bacterium]|nr:hypothetical protein [Erysipelotrichaceae bacterium]
MICETKFREIYGKDAEFLLFCPYRISPLGAHIDHQDGIINGLAIGKGIYIACSPKKNGIIELHSVNFPKRAQFHIDDIEDQKVGDWADYLRGVTRELKQKHQLKYGLCGVIEGQLPVGGLSSSAAVTIVFLSALAKINGIRLDPWDLIMMAKAAENNYVGVKCGKLDQCCEVLSRKEKLLYLDCKDDSYELIDLNPDMKPFRIAIFFSGLQRSLANSDYNLRQDECKAAAYSLMAYAGMKYGKFADAKLRDVPAEVFETYKDQLPLNFRKRAVHFFGEIDRARRGAEAFRNGDLEEYGKLIFESGKSSIVNYECGCRELISLYDIMTQTEGIYGGRFSGAGFKGCCMALIDPEREEEICKRVSEEYLKIYPELKDSYTCCICDSSDGVKL